VSLLDARRDPPDRSEVLERIPVERKETRLVSVVELRELPLREDRAALRS
jgi:hypothetical protein